MPRFPHGLQVTLCRPADLTSWIKFSWVRAAASEPGPPIAR